jgi:protein gp37
VIPVFSWHPVTGCTRLSPGCAICPALDRLALTESGGAIRFDAVALEQPLHLAAPHLVAVCPAGDLFHRDVRDEWLDEIFAVMERARNQSFQLLTKRARRMTEYVLARYPGGAPDRFSFGVSGEDQAHVDERLFWLALLPSRRRFLTIAPMMEPVRLGRALSWLTAVSGGAPELPADNAEWVAALKDECTAAGVGFEWGGPLL